MDTPMQGLADSSSWLPESASSNLQTSPLIPSSHDHQPLSSPASSFSNGLPSPSDASSQDHGQSAVQHAPPQGQVAGTTRHPRSGGYAKKACDPCRDSQKGCVGAGRVPCQTCSKRGIQLAVRPPKTLAGQHPDIESSAHIHRSAIGVSELRLSTRTTWRMRSRDNRRKLSFLRSRLQTSISTLVHSPNYLYRQAFRFHSLSCTSRFLASSRAAERRRHRRRLSLPVAVLRNHLSTCYPSGVPTVLPLGNGLSMGSTCRTPE